MDSGYSGGTVSTGLQAVSLSDHAGHDLSCNCILWTASETEEALKEPAGQIVEAVIEVLERTPPELSADIVDKGVIITGGGSMLKGLAEVLEEELTIPVLTTQMPLTCVVEGTGMILDNIKLLDEVNY